MPLEGLQPINLIVAGAVTDFEAAVGDGV